MDFEDKGYGSGSEKARKRWTHEIADVHSDIAFGRFGTHLHFDLNAFQTRLTNMVIEIEDEFIRVGEEEGA